MAVMGILSYTSPRALAQEVPPPEASLLSQFLGKQGLGPAGHHVMLGNQKTSFPYGWVEQSISVVLRGFQSSCKVCRGLRGAEGQKAAMPLDGHGHLR